MMANMQGWTKEGCESLMTERSAAKYNQQFEKLNRLREELMNANQKISFLMSQWMVQIALKMKKKTYLDTALLGLNTVTGIAAAVLTAGMTGAGSLDLITSVVDPAKEVSFLVSGLGNNVATIAQSVGTTTGVVAAKMGFEHAEKKLRQGKIQKAGLPLLGDSEASSEQIASFVRGCDKDLSDLTATVKALTTVEGMTTEQINTFKTENPGVLEAPASTSEGQPNLQTQSHLYSTAKNTISQVPYSSINSRARNQMPLLTKQKGGKLNTRG